MVVGVSRRSLPRTSLIALTVVSRSRRFLSRSKREILRIGIASSRSMSSSVSGARGP